jgi:HlyD family secretion protein
MRMAHLATRRRLAAAAAVVLLGAVVAGAWLLHRNGGEATRPLTLYGNVDIRQVDLAFNESDRIVRMHVDEGDAVEPGQLLAELDGSRIEHLVAEAEARVAAQRAVLARLERGSRPEEITRARAELAAAQATMEDAARNASRLAQLAQRNAASQRAYDDARALELTTRAQVRAAKQNLALAIEGPRAEDIDAARAELRAAQNALELARHRAADTKLYAPAPGIVLTRILEPGAVVLANSPVYTIALADPVWVRTYVSEPDLGRVVPGTKAAITSDSFPDRVYAGWVGFVSPSAEFTPKTVETPDLRTSLVYRVRVYASNPDRTLRQGMPVTVRLLPETEEAAADHRRPVDPGEPAP